MKGQCQSWSPKNDGSSRQHEVEPTGSGEPTPSTREGLGVGRQFKLRAESAFYSSQGTWMDGYYYE